LKNTGLCYLILLVSILLLASCAVDYEDSRTGNDSKKRKFESLAFTSQGTTDTTTSTTNRPAIVPVRSMISPPEEDLSCKDKITYIVFYPTSGEEKPLLDAWRKEAFKACDNYNRSNPNGRCSPYGYLSVKEIPVFTKKHSSAGCLKGEVLIGHSGYGVHGADDFITTIEIGKGATNFCDMVHSTGGTNNFQFEFWGCSFANDETWKEMHKCLQPGQCITAVYHLAASTRTDDNCCSDNPNKLRKIEICEGDDPNTLANDMSCEGQCSACPVIPTPTSTPIPTMTPSMPASP
jgi:hypothetical protein